MRVPYWPVRTTMALSTKGVVSTSGCKYLIKPLVALLPIPVTGAGAAPETSFKIAIKQQAPLPFGSARRRSAIIARNSTSPAS